MPRHDRTPTAPAVAPTVLTRAAALRPTFSVRRVVDFGRTQSMACRLH